MSKAIKFFQRYSARIQNVLKLIFLAAVVGFLWVEIVNSEQTYSIFSVSRNPIVMLIVCVVILAVPLNWYIESLKWRFLMNSDAFYFSGADAFKSTLAGAAASTLLPNRIGESLGRIFWLPPSLRLPGAVQSTLGGFTQLCITLTGGALLLPVYLWICTDFTPKAVTLISIAGLVLPGLALSLLFNLRVLNFSAVSKFPGGKWIHSVRDALHQTQKQTLLRLLKLSALRYLVFTFQFAAILTVFVDSLTFASALGCVAVIYLVTAVVPSFTLAELGIRESAAVMLLAPFSHEPTAVIQATFFIWCVNIAVPSLFGLYFVLARKNLLSTTA